MGSKRRNTIQNKKKRIIAGTLLIFFIVIVLGTMTLLHRKTAVTPFNAIPTPMQGQGNAALPPVAKTAAIHLEQQGNDTVNVIVDAGTHPISGVQLQMNYDTRVLTNVTIQKGTFFSSPLELTNNIDQTHGIIQYAIAIAPTNAPQQGKGIVATITYTPNLGVTSSTKMTFLPGTKITAEGIDQSVLQLPAPFDLTITQ